MSAVLTILARIGIFTASFCLLCSSLHAAPAGDLTILFQLTGDGLPKKLVKTPASLTQVVAKLLRSEGTRLDVADASIDDSALVLGCEPNEMSCLDTISEMLGNTELRFGMVHRDGRGVRITLMRYRPDEPLTAEVLHINKNKHSAVVREFVSKYLNLLRGHDTKPATAESTSPETANKRSGWSTSKVQTESPERRPGRTRPLANETADERQRSSVDELPSAPVESVEATKGGFNISQVRGYTWAIVGVSTSAAVAGGLLLGAAASAKVEAKRAPRQTRPELRHLAAIERRGRTQGFVGIPLVAVGAAGLGAGAIMAWLQASEPESAESSNLALVPWLAPRAAGVTAIVRLTP